MFSIHIRCSGTASLRATATTTRRRLFVRINRTPPLTANCYAIACRAEHNFNCDAAIGPLFDRLLWLESRLSANRYVRGETLTEADWQLFKTLIRFDLVYYLHFKCNRAHIVAYPNLWGYLRALYQRPGMAQTVQFNHILRHYHYRHERINPHRIIPTNPLLAFTTPHGRN